MASPSVAFSEGQLRYYVPQLLVDRGAAPFASGFLEVEGTLLSADLSGFTKLSERLARIGKEGAEELTEVLNDCFDRMIAVVRREGGDILKFGGDALLILYTGAGHTTRAVPERARDASAHRRAGRRAVRRARETAHFAGDARGTVRAVRGDGGPYRAARHGSWCNRDSAVRRGGRCRGDPLVGCGRRARRAALARQGEGGRAVVATCRDRRRHLPRPLDRRAARRRRRRAVRSGCAAGSHRPRRAKRTPTGHGRVSQVLAHRRVVRGRWSGRTARPPRGAGRSRRRRLRDARRALARQRRLSRRRKAHPDRRRARLLRTRRGAHAASAPRHPRCRHRSRSPRRRELRPGLRRQSGVRPAAHVHRDGRRGESGRAPHAEGRARSARRIGRVARTGTRALFDRRPRTVLRQGQVSADRRGRRHRHRERTGAGGAVVLASGRSRS